MEIKLTHEESEEYFYNALCNEGGQLNGYGIELDYSKEDYKNAKLSWVSKNPESSACIEDILMEILRNGGQLTLNDIEGEGDNTKSITLKDVHERVQKAPLSHLVNMINEEDDAETADVILQTVFLEEIVFG
jgi:hypothetical protein